MHALLAHAHTHAQLGGLNTSNLTHAGAASKRTRDEIKSEGGEQKQHQQQREEEKEEEAAAAAAQPPQ